MLSIKQVVVIGVVAVLMVGLLSLDIKGIVSTKKSDNRREQKIVTSKITIESVSTAAKQKLSENLQQQIADLEKNLERANESEKIKFQKQLAQKWDDVNALVPSAFYYEFIANKEVTYFNWLRAGDKFSSAYQQGTQDTVVQLLLVQKAIVAYQKAQELQPNSLDAKIGLGVSYVNGTSDPMKGIRLLLEVVKVDPNNVRANMSLGLFAMKSGQFEKAVKRFQVVTSQTNQPEAWFYLASSYENIGMKDEAVIAYNKTKELAADPSLSQFIDRKIKKLKY